MLRFVAGVVLVLATLAGSTRFEAIDLHRFELAWAGVLVALDGLARLRAEKSPLRSSADWLWTGLASIAFWDLFELLDLRLHNWWYTGLSPHPLRGALDSALSFATVLPAVRLAVAALSPAQSSVYRCAPVLRPQRLLLLGLAMLGAALAAPRFAFPLAWIFLWPLCEAALAWLPLQGALPSPLQSWRGGDRRLPLRLAALGIPLGLVWEGLNWHAARGWLYTVPFFERPKLFEMPLAGYLGYVPFLLEAGAALALLERLRPALARPRVATLAIAAVAALHLGTDALGRRGIGLSTAPRLAELAAVPGRSPETEGEVRRLASLGIDTPVELLRAGTPSPLAAAAELEVSTHLGLPRASRLLEAGIDRRALAAQDAQTLSFLTGDPPAVWRVFIARAALATAR